MTTIENVTREQIQALRSEAAQTGDFDRILMCDLAEYHFARDMAGSRPRHSRIVSALTACVAVINEAEAQSVLDAAAKFEMTRSELEEQRRSFAYGNANIENEHVTRETIDQAAAELEAKESTMTTTRNIPLSELTEASDTDADFLDPSDYDGRILVDYRTGRCDLIDGFHRASGLISWAISEGRELSSIVVTVIDCTEADEDLVAAAACPEGYGDMSQEDAIAALTR